MNTPSEYETRDAVAGGCARGAPPGAAFPNPCNALRRTGERTGAAANLRATPTASPRPLSVG
jgi:hypothetical protein